METKPVDTVSSAIGAKVRARRTALRPRVSQAALAAQLRVTRAQVANYESGRTPIPPGVVRKLSVLWGVSERWFFDVPRARSVANAGYASRYQAPMINLVPYWGQVPCGDWQMPDGDGDLIQISESIDPLGVVAVKVSGDSMAPRLIHGQTVVIRLDKTPREGVITLACNGYGELTLKVLRYVKGEWQLHSINPDHGVVSADRWEILGYAVGLEEHDSQGIRP